MGLSIVFLVLLSLSESCPLPPIVPVSDNSPPQYTVWDAWNDTHPLFCSNNLQVNINCSQAIVSNNNYTKCVIDLISTHWSLRNITDVAIRCVCVCVFLFAFFGGVKNDFTTTKIESMGILWDFIFHWIIL